MRIPGFDYPAQINLAEYERWQRSRLREADARAAEAVPGAIIALDRARHRGGDDNGAFRAIAAHLGGLSSFGRCIPFLTVTVQECVWLLPFWPVLDMLVKRDHSGFGDAESQELEGESIADFYCSARGEDEATVFVAEGAPEDFLPYMIHVAGRVTDAVLSAWEERGPDDVRFLSASPVPAPEAGVSAPAETASTPLAGGTR